MIDSQIGPHDDEEVAPFGNFGQEELSVSDGLLRRMDRAGADDHNKSIIISGQDSCTVVAGRGDSLLGGRGRNNLMAEQSGLNKRVVLEKSRVSDQKCGAMAVMVEGTYADNATVLNVALKPSCAAGDGGDTTRSLSRRHVFGDC